MRGVDRTWQATGNRRGEERRGREGEEGKGNGEGCGGEGGDVNDVCECG